MNTQKGFSTVLGIIILLVIVGGIYWFMNKGEQLPSETSYPETNQEEGQVDNQSGNAPKASTQEEQKQANNVVGHCGLVVSSHKPNDLVDWPIVINGKVEQDKLDDNCFWQTFEGVSGTAQLYVYEDNSWRTIGESQIFGPNFSLNFNFPEAGLQINNPIKIIFTEENPAAQSPSLVFELPLVLK